MLMSKQIAGDYKMEFIFAFMLIGLIPAAIAKSKGRNPFLWWIYGVLLFIPHFPDESTI